MISINATLVLQVVHFLVLVYILNRLMFKPILKLVNERTGYMEKSKTEMTELESEAERLKQEYRSLESEARKKASRENLEMKKDGVAQVDAMIDESQEEVASIRRDSEAKIESEFEKARPSLQSEATVLAEEIVERLIGRRVAG
jgi:F-type H+-transporting ATPase subunit b